MVYLYFHIFPGKSIYELVMNFYKWMIRGCWVPPVMETYGNPQIALELAPRGSGTRHSSFSSLARIGRWWSLPRFGICRGGHWCTWERLTTSTDSVGFPFGSHASGCSHWQLGTSMLFGQRHPPNSSTLKSFGWGKMLVYGSLCKCLAPILTIAACLSQYFAQNSAMALVIWSCTCELSKVQNGTDL